VEILYFLVPLALIFIAIAVKVLFWAINSGQYDNLDTEAHRILFDEQESKKPLVEYSTPNQPHSKFTDQQKQEIVDPSRDK